MKNKWEQLVETRLTYEQIQLLRMSLQLDCPVYFYGDGLGKSTIAEALKNSGYVAYDCGEFLETTGQNYMDGIKVPCVAFRLVNTNPEYIPDIYEYIQGHTHDVKAWVKGI